MELKKTLVSAVAAGVLAISSTTFAAPPSGLAVGGLTTGTLTTIGVVTVAAVGAAAAGSNDSPLATSTATSTQ